MNDMIHEQALDCKGLNCPLPILKTKKQIAEGNYKSKQAEYRAKRTEKNLQEYLDLDAKSKKAKSKKEYDEGEGFLFHFFLTIFTCSCKFHFIS